MKKQQLEQLIEEQKAYIAKLQQQLANLDNNLSNSQQHVNELNKKLQLQKTMHLQQQKAGLSNI